MQAGAPQSPSLAEQLWSPEPAPAAAPAVESHVGRSSADLTSNSSIVHTAAPLMIPAAPPNSQLSQPDSAADGTASSSNLLAAPFCPGAVTVGEGTLLLSAPRSETASAAPNPSASNSAVMDASVSPDAPSSSNLGHSSSSPSFVHVHADPEPAQQATLSGAEEWLPVHESPVALSYSSRAYVLGGHSGRAYHTHHFGEQYRVDTMQAAMEQADERKVQVDHQSDPEPTKEELQQQTRQEQRTQLRLGEQHIRGGHTEEK
jgi:hypothetical protein